MAGRLTAEAEHVELARMRRHLDRMGFLIKEGVVIEVVLQILSLGVESLLVEVPKTSSQSAKVQEAGGSPTCFAAWSAGSRGP